MEAWRQASTPVHSNVADTSPRGWPLCVVDLTVSATCLANSSLASMVSGRFMGTTMAASANPLSTANRTRSSWMSAMTTLASQTALLMAAQRRPTVPAPNTRTVEPGARRALSDAWRATDRGSTRAPSSSETSDGSLFPGVSRDFSPFSEPDVASKFWTYLWHHLAGWEICSCRVPWAWG